MKRNNIALVLQPFKNSVVDELKLKTLCNAFASDMLSALSRFTNLRWNIVLPGYMLDYISQKNLLSLRSLIQQETAEMLTTGYTEPFLSLSPQWLLLHNIQRSIDLFHDKLGIKPRGYLPPFSNWEPSCIATLNEAGMSYAVLSNVVFPLENRYTNGYWTTEHLGDSTTIIPSHTVKLSGHPITFHASLEAAILHARRNQVPCIKLLIDITKTSKTALADRIATAAHFFENNLLNLHPLTFEELLTLNSAAGIQYLPQSLVIRRDAPERISYFKNHLFSYEQIGILHRKLMEIARSASKIANKKQQKRILDLLYWAQDINCFLPGDSSGFISPVHRLWSYEKMIRTEMLHYSIDNVSGGQIKIFDFFKNGMKTLTMSNKKLKLYIHYQSGGSIFGLDYRPMHLNLNATYSSNSSSRPDIIVPGKSKSCFVDRLLLPSVTRADYINRRFAEQSDAYCGKYDYDVTRNSRSMKSLLKYNGSFCQQKKRFPITIEKAFTLQEKNPLFSFSYQLYNLSLSPLHFRLAIELNFMFPGVLRNEAFAFSDKKKYTLSNCAFTYSNTSKWRIEDRMTGLRLIFATVKPLDIWIYDFRREDPSLQQYQGTAIILTTCIHAKENIDWSLTGNITFKQDQQKVTSFDEI